jgi:hypothetical protein
MESSKGVLSKQFDRSLKSIGAPNAFESIELHFQLIVARNLYRLYGLMLTEHHFGTLNDSSILEFSSDRMSSFSQWRVAS